MKAELKFDDRGNQTVLTLIPESSQDRVQIKAFTDTTRRSSVIIPFGYEYMVEPVKFAIQPAPTSSD